MAQSLDDKAPLFCFKEDNRFTNEDVMSRLNFMKLAAASQGIEIIGFSSDGDKRLQSNCNYKFYVYWRK